MEFGCIMIMRLWKVKKFSLVLILFCAFAGCATVKPLRALSKEEKAVRFVKTSEAINEFLHENCKYLEIANNISTEREARIWAFAHGVNVLEILYVHKWQVTGIRNKSGTKYDFAAFKCP